MQGFYNDPPSAWYYGMQLSAFLIITLVSKFILGVIVIEFELEFDKVGSWMCLPFKNNPAAELTFVMVVCPAVLNIIQYWIQDNILMDSREIDAQYVLVGGYCVYCVFVVFDLTRYILLKQDSVTACRIHNIIIIIAHH